MKKTKAFLLLLALGALTPACGSTSVEICDLVCDCEGCSDREYDECVVNTDAYIDRAEAYDCGAELADFEDCVLETADCDGDDFEIDLDCGDELIDVESCINDESGL